MTMRAVVFEEFGGPLAALGYRFATAHRAITVHARPRPRLPMDRVVDWELELYVSHGMAAREYPPMLARIAAGELRPQALVGRVSGLDQARDALAAMGGPSAATGMAVVVP